MAVQPTKVRKKKAGKKSVNRSRNLLRKDGRNRTAEARKRLGLTREQIDEIPRLAKITHLLQRADGGVDGCIAALRGDDSEEAQDFIEKWDSVSDSDRAQLSVEEIALAADITSRRLLETVTGALLQQAQDITKLIVATSQPRIVEKTVEMALTDKGFGDRELFHKATRFLPTPKGSETTVNVQQNTLPAPGDEPEDGCPAPPNADDFLLDMQSVLRPAKAIEAPEPAVRAHIPELEYITDDV